VVGVAFVVVGASPLLALHAYDASTMRMSATIHRVVHRDAADAGPGMVRHVGDWMHPRRACRPTRASSVAAVEDLIACEAMAWDAPGGPTKAIDVAWCESRLHPAALNPTGCSGAGCGGLFQQHLGFWAARARKAGVGDRSAFDPWANVVVSVQMAARKGTWVLDWPVCGRAP
jgi:hypothetical protein